MELDRREILRYMGYGKTAVLDEQTEALIEEAAGELLRTMEPRSVFQIFPVRETTDEYVDLGFTVIRSRNLAKNLKGCHEAVFLAATLGSSVDYLIRRYSSLQVSRALVIQAAAADAVDKYCDACEEEICRQIGDGNYLRPRFSPGYGDFPLEFQKEFLQILEAPKRIGLTLTDGYLMMPSKSVTAVIGVSRENSSCIRQGCELCGKKDCLYRR